jgi:ribulose-phosphate 3-epimerase
MNKTLLCPSTMCIDFHHLDEEIKSLDEAGVDIFHNDIMDGTFVPNMTLGINDIKAIRRSTNKPMDVHLMIENPSSKVDWFIDAGADIVYIHPESERYVVKTLAHIKEKGKEAGIAINPDTSIDSIEEMLNLCDYVLVMTVNPGFAGQKFIDFTKKKVERLVKLKEIYGFKIIIDGACSPQVIKDLSILGADGFVLGTSALFGKGKPYKDVVEELRNL